MYRARGTFPKEEMYGLTSQLRRSADIRSAQTSLRDAAEGQIQKWRRFLQIAMGSAAELEYHLLLARDLRLLKELGIFRELLGEVMVKEINACWQISGIAVR